MSFRVFIPTAGTGSRLGRLTSNINKSLISVANRPVLSHQIDKFSDKCEFVIALGYKGSLVREFLSISYPDHRFLFVDIHPFQGSGSGLGFTLLCCKKYLQEPFVFLSCDTLVVEEVPSPKQNWVGCAESEDISAYRTLCINDKGVVQSIHEKGASDANSHLAYIGLAGINNCTEFWNSMDQGLEASREEGEAYGLRSLLDNDSLLAHTFTWFDTGTPEALSRAKCAYSLPGAPNILEKSNEFIWFIDSRVIKFCDDRDFIANRVRRAQILKAFIPKMLASSNHMYSYERVEGRTFSQVATLPLFKRLLRHCAGFWETSHLDQYQLCRFHDRCYRFYHDKTKKRLLEFYQTFDKQDGSQPINDVHMPTMTDLLSLVDWDSLSNGMAGRFHGDFHFENILWDQQIEKFIFLDWRQDFGDDLIVGDIYYDLAKLLHGLIVSHDVVTKGAFSIIWSENAIHYELYRKQSLVECERYFSEWCRQNQFDYARVKILAALIFVNIACLHHYPYSLLLYALGKHLLATSLEENAAD